ncbi:MAG: ATP-binding protein [Rhodospirillales bacterium]|nr:ATP-binding protein [Rhodospirillales bacterium]
MTYAAVQSLTANDAVDEIEEQPTFVPIANRRIGRVASVSGAQVVVLVEDDDTAENAEAKAMRKGSLVKLRIDGYWVFGLVTALTVPVPAGATNEPELRFAEIALLGEIEATETDNPARNFKRGVSFYPTVADDVYLADQQDMMIVYAKPSSSSVSIGTIYQDRSIPAYVLIDTLLGKHFAILGTTGTGKSCASALILRRILEVHGNGHVVLLDPHNEYTAAFPDLAERIEAASLQLPYWLYTFEELAAALLGSKHKADDVATELRILAEVILEAKKSFSGNNTRAKQITVNTPVPYHMGDVVKILNREMGQLDKAESNAPYLKLISRINNLSSDARYKFMFGGIMVHDNMESILSRLFRIPGNGKPMTILDLSAVPSEVLNIVVAVLCRITFDFGLYSEGALPILLVCEEAHRYVPEDSKLGFEPTKRILSRIAKEGRKYGVSLGIVSQRPSDLSLNALSQCNTILALRLTSNTDQEFVRGVMPDWSDGLLDFLPSLRNSEAIIVGEGVPVPARVRFDVLPEGQRPRSATASFSRAWGEDADNASLVQRVMKKWRSGQ